MAEFDDKLNSLLSNPEAMDQIMKMAQSLMGNDGRTEQPPPSAAAPWRTRKHGDKTAGSRFSRVAPSAERQHIVGASPARKAETHLPAGLWRAVSRGLARAFLSGLGDLDPKAIASLLPVLRELGEAQNSNARQLLFALRPYLKPERQDKVERALQLARLFRVGKKFLLRGDGHV